MGRENAMSRPTRQIMFLLGLFIAGPVLAQDQWDDANTKEVVNHFLKSLSAKEVNMLMKLVDLPWLGEGQEVIKDPKKLKDLLRRKANEAADPKVMAWKITVVPYSRYKAFVSDDGVRKVFT